MHKPNKIPLENKNWRVNYDTVREMSQLPLKQKGPMGDTMPLGIPSKYIELVRYTYVRRSALRNSQADRTVAGIQEILGKIALHGGSTTEPTTDSLFWCARAWFINRQAPLSRYDLEYDDELPHGREIFRRASPTATVFRSMAAWACRYTAPQPEFMPLCVQIRNEIQYGGNSPDLPSKPVAPKQTFTRSFSFPCPKTAAWCRWLGYACGTVVPLPPQELGTWEHHHDRWKEMGLRPYHAEIVQAAYEKIFDEVRRPIRERALRKQANEKNRGKFTHTVSRTLPRQNEQTT